MQKNFRSVRKKFRPRGASITLSDLGTIGYRDRELRIGVIQEVTLLQTPLPTYSSLLTKNKQQLQGQTI